MDMYIQSARGNNFAFRRDYLGTGSNDYIDTGLYIWITSFANRCNSSIAKTDIGLVDPCMINN